MTIATRNKFIRAAALIALSFAITAVVCVILILVKKRLPAEMIGTRATFALKGIPFAQWSSRASIAAIAIYPFFALAGLLYILFAFEKTQTVEITFFAACLFAISFETLRLFIPLYQTWIHGDFLAVAVSRAVLVSRIFVLLGLLASGIFTTGQTAQQLGPSVFLLAFFSFGLGSAIPLNSSRMSANFLVIPGYSGMLSLFMLLLGFLAVLSYLIPGKMRVIPEYKHAAFGLILFLAGYALLSLCDSWAFFGAGAALFIAGSWLYLERLHRYYLWQ